MSLSGVYTCPDSDNPLFVVAKLRKNPKTPNISIHFLPFRRQKSELLPSYFDISTKYCTFAGYYDKVFNIGTDFLMVYRCS